MGDRFRRGLDRVGERSEIVKQVRGRGLMIGMEFGDDDGRFSLESLYRRLVEAGFLAGYKPAARLLRFYPPLIIEEQDVARLLEHLGRIL